MGWKRKAGFGCGGVLVLAVALVLWALVAKPWLPPVQMVAPGPGGKRIHANGLTGNFYPARAGSVAPAILIFGGSEGGLSIPVSRHARALHAAGYAVFHFSWWRGPGQSQRIGNIPIESFDRALAWLKAQPGVDSSRIAVFGWSRGSEAAQLLALRHPEIGVVVLGMPANAVWPGFDWNFLAGMPKYAWTLGGRPYPRVPDEAMAFHYRQPWTPAEFARYSRVLARNPAALIPIERIHGSVLMICGGLDGIWPSCPMGRALLARATAHGKRDVTLLAYPKAGHMGYGGPVADGDAYFARQVWVGGGDVAANRAALDESFAATLALLKDRLAAPGK